MAVKRKTVLHSLHVAISVISLMCCIFSGFNHCLPYPELIINSSILMPNVATESSSDNDAQKEFLRKHTDRANLDKDPRSWTMLPFLITTVTTALLAVGGQVWQDLFESTAILNADIGLFVIHITTLLMYMTYDEHDIGVDLWENWHASTTAVMTLHVIALVLLFAVVVGCGFHLVRSKVSWPCCNFLKMFTVGMVFTLVRLVMCSSIMSRITGTLATGLESANKISNVLCSELTCVPFRAPLATFYGATTVLGVALVVSIENFLSHMWGSEHRMMTRIAALMSGVTTFIAGSTISPISLPWTSTGVPFSEVLALSALCFIHVWLMWLSPGFLSAPPNILKLLCGVKVGSQRTEGSGGATEDVVDGNLEVPGSTGGCGQPHVRLETLEASTSERASPETNQDSSRLPLALRFLENLFVLVLCLSSTGFLGETVEWGGDHVMGWSEVLLVATVTAIAERAAVAIIAVVTSRTPPVSSGPQHVVTIVLEAALVLITAVATMVYGRDLHLTVSAAIALSVVVFKVLSWAYSGPILRTVQHFKSGEPRHMALVSVPSDNGPVQGIGGPAAEQEELEGRFSSHHSVAYNADTDSSVVNEASP